jgi:hypothetical protein
MHFQVQIQANKEQRRKVKTQCEIVRVNEPVDIVLFGKVALKQL